jgi:hypothetical protein
MKDGRAEAEAGAGAAWGDGQLADSSPLGGKLGMELGDECQHLLWRMWVSWEIKGWWRGFRYFCKFGWI